MARNQKHYDTDYKVQSVNLAKEIGLSKAARELGIIQSMNSDGGRCHDNARCESMWARLKDELFYSRNLKSTDFTVVQLKKMVWRYFMSYWNNRRICSSNDGLPPKVKRDRYYAALPMAAQLSNLYELNVKTIIDNINMQKQKNDILQQRKKSQLCNKKTA